MSKSKGKSKGKDSSKSKKKTTFKGGFSMNHPYAEHLADSKITTAPGGPNKNKKSVPVRGSISDSHFDKSNILALNKNSRD